MRNSKVKGFTLIELIVVIAIIGILAAILVPSMLGYVRNARISQANANAKQVHTAISSGLTQMAIANLKPASDGVEFEAADLVVGSEQRINTTRTDIPTYNLDLEAYLGDSQTFKGNAFCAFNKDTYAVQFATWNADTYWYTQLCEKDQKSYAKDGDVYGVYPLMVGDNSVDFSGTKEHVAGGSTGGSTGGTTGGGQQDNNPPADG